MNKCFLSSVNDFHEVIQNQVTFLAKLLDRVNFSGNVRVDRAEIREGDLNSPCRSWCLRMCLAGVCGVRGGGGERELGRGVVQGHVGGFWLVKRQERGMLMS